MKITEKRLRQIIRSVIKESREEVSFGALAGQPYAGLDQIQALGRSMPKEFKQKLLDATLNRIDKKELNKLDQEARLEGYVAAEEVISMLNKTIRNIENHLEKNK